MGIRRAARVVAWILASGVLLVVALYLAMFAINWSDEPPSADALQLQRVVRDRPVVADKDNAYVFVLGLAAPLNQDPIALGVARKRFLEKFEPSGVDGKFEDFPGSDIDYDAARPQAIKDLVETCRKGNEACVQGLEADPARLDRWLASESWLLDRYLHLIELDAWVETLPKGMSAPFPKYQHAIHAQTLLLMRVWQRAREGDGDAARAWLQKDLVFWRHVLRSSDILLTKMIATVAIERNFRLGNLALRELQRSGKPVAPPEAWRAPIDAQERSMRRSMGGEWSVTSSGMGAVLRDPMFGNKVYSAPLRPMLKPQATSNLYATHMLRIANGLEVDYRALPAASRALAPENNADERIYRAYNPLGYILYRIAAENDYSNYAVRVSDLEGTRRATLLATELRAAGADAEDAPRRLQASPLNDPYTDAPFAWDAEHHSIVFIGLAAGDRARHEVLL